MSDIDEIRLDQAKKIETKSKWDCGKHEGFSQEHIEECLSEMLAAYADDERNYVVDGAIIECDQMSNRPVQMFHKDGKLQMIGEGGSVEVDYNGTISPYEKLYLEIDRNEEAIGTLYAVHADNQTDMNLRYATVADRVCLREIVDREKKGEKSACEASLVSFGNCKIMRNSDVLEVKERIHKAARYGTCYCLMKPDWQWQNPYCMESVTGNCDAENNSRLNSPTAGVASVLDFKPTCTTTSHHKTMEWDTKEGKKEGLTCLSTLLCTRGGVITIKYSGQYPIIINDVDDNAGNGIIDGRYLRLLNKANEKRGIWISSEHYKIDFVEKVFPLLLIEESRSGIPAEILFAQICIESAYGSAAPGNNYFGIKANGNESSVTSETKEEVNGKEVTIVDEFKAYASMEESIEDHTDLLLNNYQEYVTTGSIEDWCDALVEGGYATDSEYKQKVINTCKTWGICE